MGIVTDKILVRTMKVVAFVLALALGGYGFPVAANPPAAEHPLVTKGFDHFYNLEYTEALALFRKAAQERPGDPAIHNHIAQAILYREMLRAGALESELVTGNNPFLRREHLNPSPQDQKEFDDELRRAVSLSEARLQANPKDVKALYALGVSHGIRANYNFLVRKAWRDALREATKARKYHDRVLEIDPNNMDARLVRGAHEYVIGSLPFSWRMLGFLIGMRGNKEDGIRTLESVAARGETTSLDAKILLGAIYRREKKPERAIPLVKELMAQFPRNYLLYFEQAQMFSDMGDSANALAALDKLQFLKRSGARGYTDIAPEKIYFAKGNIQFWYRKLDPALENMRRAVAGADELDLNTGVLAWMRLGQIYDLKGERKLAIQAYNQAIAFAPDSDAAKESRRYLEKRYRRADIPG